MFEICKMEWNEVMWMIERLADKLQGKQLFGIHRAGALVAAMMSYHGCELAGSYEQTDVVVDDIADTGKTLSTVYKVTATLVVRRGCNPWPNYWVMMLDVKDYVWFPWETEQEHVNFLNTHYKGEHSEQ